MKKKIYPFRIRITGKTKSRPSKRELALMKYMNLIVTRRLHDWAKALNKDLFTK